MCVLSDFANLSKMPRCITRTSFFVIAQLSWFYDCGSTVSHPSNSWASCSNVNWNFRLGLLGLHTVILSIGGLDGMTFSTKVSAKIFMKFSCTQNFVFYSPGAELSSLGSLPSQLLANWHQIRRPMSVIDRYLSLLCQTLVFRRLNPDWTVVCKLPVLHHFTLKHKVA